MTLQPKFGQTQGQQAVIKISPVQIWEVELELQKFRQPQMLVAVVSLLQL